MGNHTVTVGTRNEYVWLRNMFTQSSLGVWSFRNLDSMAAGNANSFRKALILSDGGNVYYAGLQNAFYAQDQWTPTPRLAITAGMRFDLSNSLYDIPYNAPIDSAYGRKTSDIPKHSLQYSPRLGFNWDATGDRRNQLRGGLGLFVGTPPYIWLENAYVNSGNVITFLNCNTNGSTAPAPAFPVDPTPIATCRNGAGTKPIGDVNLLAKDLKFPQPLRASLAFDRQLPWNLVGTVEGLYSRTLNQLLFVNLNVGPSDGRQQHRPHRLRQRGQSGQRPGHADPAAGCHRERRHGALLHGGRSPEPEQGLRVQPDLPAAEAVRRQLGGAGRLHVLARARRAELHLQHRALQRAVRPYALWSPRSSRTPASACSISRTSSTPPSPAPSTGGRTSAPTSRSCTRASRARRTTTCMDRAAVRRAT